MMQIQAVISLNPSFFFPFFLFCCVLANCSQPVGCCNDFLVAYSTAWICFFGDEISLFSDRHCSGD